METTLERHSEYLRRIMRDSARSVEPEQANAVDILLAAAGFGYHDRRIAAEIIRFLVYKFDRGELTVCPDCNGTGYLNRTTEEGYSEKVICHTCNGWTIIRK